jgi:predicted DNA-binding transcriptional regulator YafY
MRGEYQLPDQPRVRRVVRKVSSTFWFLREVMQYAEDCVIISPESVRVAFHPKTASPLQSVWAENPRLALGKQTQTSKLHP